MTGRYFMHLGLGFRKQALDPPALTSGLRSFGMQPLAVLGDATVFVSNDTPVLQLSTGGLVMGELYFRDGEQIIDAGQIPPQPSAEAVCDYILSNCWGDYLLVQPVPADRRALTVMRSPSHACDLQCFYCLGNGEGFITSDITLATRLGLYERRVAFDAISHRLAYPHLKTSTTALLDISELLPGCALLLEPSHHTLTQKWTPWTFVQAERRRIDMAEAALAVRSTVQMVVGAQARRDQSALLELSGGLDSSIVGASLGHSKARITCLTLTIPVPGADERDYAAAVAAVLGVELFADELGLDDMSLEFALPQELVSPAVGILQFAVDRIMQRAADLHDADSFFSGAGGDTVFCYLSTAAPAADAFRAAGLATGLRAIHNLSEFHQCTYWRATHLAMRTLAGIGPQHEADPLLLSQGLRMPPPEVHPWNQPPFGALPGDKQRIAELASTQLFREGCIRGLTRSFRMPLLSQPVIEACLRVPSWMWFNGGQNRAVARRAFADALPPKVINRKSKGTFTAYLGALYRRNSAGLLAFLAEGELHAHGLLDATALHRLSRAGHDASEESFMRVFHLCAVENWVRQQSRTHQR